MWSHRIIVGFSPDYGFTDKCVANLTQEFYRYLFDRCISICIIFTNSKGSELMRNLNLLAATDRPFLPAFRGCLLGFVCKLVCKLQTQHCVIYCTYRSYGLTVSDYRSVAWQVKFKRRSNRCTTRWDKLPEVAY